MQISQLQEVHPQHQKALNSFYLGLKPDPKTSVDDWADKNRWLSDRESPMPGQWRNARVPYLIKPMQCLSPKNRATEVVMMFGAQLGKSETGNNWIGHNIDCAPGPMLLVQPTVEIGKRYSRQRIAPMIEATPKLSLKVSESKSRDSGNNTLSKEFPGGVLIITGANSAAGLRSMPCRYLFMDEIDAYPEDVDGEGEPCSLAEARTRNYNLRKKILYTSTPTFEGRSRISNKFYEGDQNYYWVPCPDCNQKQILKFSNLKYDGDRPENIRNIKYVCDHCGVLIPEYKKTWMLDNGEWIAKNPAASGYCVSFHLSSLYSPVGWFSWEEIVRQWLQAQGNPNKLRVFINTVLAETWKEKGEAPDWKKLYDRRESYQTNTIPDKSIVFLTAGVDVQADRLECEIIGWNRYKQSWSIDYRQIYGDPEDLSETGPWNEISKILDEKWIHPNGIAMEIVRMGIDEAYKTHVVRAFVKSKSTIRVLSTRGSDSAHILIGHPKIVEVDNKGKTIKRGMKYWPLGSSIAKHEIYGWLNQEKPTVESGNPYPPGYCFFPEYDEEYFKQLTSEQIVVRIVKGYRRYMWEKTRDRNEVLDIRVIARAVASAYGMDRFKPEKWDELEEAVAIVAKTVQNTPGDSPKPGGATRRKSEFWKK